MTLMESNQTAAPAAVVARPCALCVGDGGDCLRCGGTGTDPDPQAPVLDGAQ